MVDVEAEPVVIDTGVAHAARIYDHYLGGIDNFAVDREAAERAAAVHPGGMATVRASVRANRAFLGQAVRYLALDAGVRQFLDIGTGIPNADNVHGVAQQVAPDSRVVYVDNDPVVLAHAHELLRSTPQGATAYVNGDLRDPKEILLRAEATLDLTEPVAVMVLGVLHFFPDGDDPYGIVARLLDAVAPGSHLVVSHLAADIHRGEMATVAERFNRTTNETWVLRTHVEVAHFFAGLDLVDPGVVQVNRWRPVATTPTPPDGGTNPLWVGVGRTGDDTTPAP